MFEKVSHAAEQIAVSASRREFLGKVGRGALATTAALGGVLALPAISAAGRKPPTACPAGSGASCSGLNVGDACFEEYTGVCKASRRNGGACYCDIRAPRR